MNLDADVLILGGGCAGLSLAVALAEHAPQLRVTTLEQRASYVRDHTWCFWNTTDHPFRPGITHEWQQWRVSNNTDSVHQCSARYKYQHLPADRFYTLAQEKLHQAKQDLLLGVAATEVHAKDDFCEVISDQGSVRARWVFDARTLPQNNVDPLLWQRFYGWHVRCDRPCFDPDVVDLMRFEQSHQRGRTEFLYLLPFSAFEALVEVTYFDFACMPPADGRARLRERVTAISSGSNYEVLYEESGSLPMGQRQKAKRQAELAIPIGTRGGRVKPSSGYAFQRIQKQSLMLAQALGRGRGLPTRFEPWIYTPLDRIFLSALIRKPQRTADYFLELFRNLPPDVLVPFLSETAKPRNIVSTLVALPARDFLEAALFQQPGAIT